MKERKRAQTGGTVEFKRKHRIGGYENQFFKVNVPRR